MATSAGRRVCVSLTRLQFQKGTVVVITFDTRIRRDTDFSIGNFTGPDSTMTWPPLSAKR